MAGNWFTRAFGNAVDDIRSKLIEEPWFGRELHPHRMDVGEDVSFYGRQSEQEPSWWRNAFDAERSASMNEPVAREIGQDLDR